MAKSKHARSRNRGPASKPASEKGELGESLANAEGEKISADRSRSRSIREYRRKLIWWSLNTIAAAFVGFWLADAISCIERAKEKVEVASQNTGFLPYSEECFLLPPIVQPTSNANEIASAEKELADAENSLKRCIIPCFFSKKCRELKSELGLSKANFALLTGDCRGALDEIDDLRKYGPLSKEASITWVWAKAEAEPNSSSYRQAIDLLRRKDDDACLSTTRGSFLRRLALSYKVPRKDLLRAALVEHNKAIALNPRSVLADYNRAIVLMELGETVEAQMALDAAWDHLQGRQDPYWHSAQAKFYEMIGENQKALAELTAAVESGYPDPEFRLSRGWIWLRLGRYDEAERDFKRAEGMVRRSETSCRRTSRDNLYADVVWGLSWVKYKKDGAEAVDLEALDLALVRATDASLRQAIAADRAEFSRRMKSDE
jgi:tetratricopeptide (TPR) repeat protein